VNWWDARLTGCGARNGTGTGEDSPSAAAPILIEQKTELEQAHLIIAAPWPSARAENRYAASLLHQSLEVVLPAACGKEFEKNGVSPYSVAPRQHLLRRRRLYDLCRNVAAAHG